MEKAEIEARYLVLDFLTITLDMERAKACAKNSVNETLRHREFLPHTIIKHLEDVKLEIEKI